MRLYKGLAVLSGLVFLVSGTCLLLLIIDDKKDLSSRANYTSFKVVKPNIKTPTQLPDAGQSIDWQKIEDNLYLNPNSFDTLRVLSSDTNTASISSILGQNFKNPQKHEQIKLGKVVVEKFTYNFFGENKKVNFWQSGSNNFLEVGSNNSDTDSVINFLNQYSSEVQNRQVLGANTPDEWAQIATQIRPSVVTVLNHYCTELKFFNLPNFPLSDKTYPFCLTSMGTGFFISSNGLLATNGHIVKNLPKSSIYYALTSGKIDNLLVDFLAVYLSQSTGRVVSSDESRSVVLAAKNNKESLYQLGGLIVDLNQKNILKFTNEKNNYFLQLNSNPAEITDKGVVESDAVISASLVDSDYQEISDSQGFVSSDVAILKANKGAFPALMLGSIEDAVVGSEIEVVGFPLAASSGLTLVDSNSAEPTFTKGVVSAIKLAKGNQKKLIQTDAIINHGNSGGPAVLSNGEVVGIATYGVTVEDGAGSYNFLRDIKDIQDLAQKNNLELSEGSVSTKWRHALNNYYLNYYKYSLADFEEIKKLYPQHPTVEKFIQGSKQKLATVEDQTPKLTVKTRQLFIQLSTISLIFSFLVFLGLLFLINKKTVTQTVI